MLEPFRSLPEVGVVDDPREALVRSEHTFRDAVHLIAKDAEDAELLD